MAEALQAIIEETVYRNEENGYSVVVTHVGREEVTVVGTLPPLAAGEQAVFEGGWAEHPQYGRQWKATACEIKKPTTLLGIERFLGSGLIRGVGPATAKLIIGEFGLKTLDIMSEDPNRLREVPGIGKKRALQIAASFNEQYAARQTMVFLQSYGVPPALAMKISRFYGERAQEVLRQNPYRLIDDVDGVGFQTADRIAITMGIAQDSEFRLRYGLKYVLQDAAMSAGHTYLPREMLLNRAAEMLKSRTETLDAHLNALLLLRELVSSQVNGQEGIFLKNVYYAEAETAVRLMALQNAAPVDEDDAVQARIRKFEEKHGIRFSPLQRKAVSMAVQSGTLVITGGPGTGKTTIINCILSLLNGETLLAAPTGRAAKRMSEATGQEARTLHRLLEFSGDEERFARNQDNPLDCECVIVDEMSMVDVFLMRSLLRALKDDTRLILVGDADQLPSVGAGNVLRDILSSGALPSVRLTDIFRQSEESLIVLNAHRINRGEAPILNRRDSDFFFDRRWDAEEAAQAVVALCRTRLPKFLKTEDGRQIQVLAPAKKGPCGVIRLNQLLQNALNPPSLRKREIVYGGNTFREGDKVMHVKNNYKLTWQTDDGGEGEGVFNGDMGVITAIDREDQVVTVRYDDERTVEYEYAQLEELELAYCLSVHKSQGSEFPAMVLPVVGGPKMLLTRNLFYTALTRARRLVVLVGREDVIGQMVENDHIATRYTALETRIKEIMRL